jgi:hypothetical protein
MKNFFIKDYIPRDVYSISFPVKALKTFMEATVMMKQSMTVVPQQGADPSFI